MFIFIILLVAMIIKWGKVKKRIFWNVFRVIFWDLVLVISFCIDFIGFYFCFRIYIFLGGENKFLCVCISFRD